MAKIPLRHYSRDLAFKVIFMLSEHKTEKADRAFKYLSEEFYKDLKDTEFAVSIIDNAIENKDTIIKWITEFATSFDIDKTNPIDICILNVVITEIFFLTPPTPIPIAVNEALLLA